MSGHCYLLVEAEGAAHLVTHEDGESEWRMVCDPYRNVFGDRLTVVPDLPMCGACALADAEVEVDV